MIAVHISELYTIIYLYGQYKALLEKFQKDSEPSVSKSSEVALKMIIYNSMTQVG